MSEVLEFPEIDTSALPPAAQQSVSSAIATLASQDLTKVALARFGDWRPQVMALAERYRNVAWDAKTTKGLNAVKEARAEVRKPRYAAQNVAKAAKSELAKVSKAIGAEEDAISAAVKEIEDPLTQIIDAREREVEAERQAAILAEEQRKEKHRAGISKLLNYVVLAAGLPSERVAKGIAVVEAMSFGAEWEEFKDEAEAARKDVLERLTAIYNRAIHAEQLQAENARLQAELAAAAAEKAERDRIEAEEKAARERANDLDIGRLVVDQSTGEILAQAAAAVVDGTLEMPTQSPEPQEPLPEPREPEPVVTAPSLTLGEIARRLGWAMPEIVLARLGVDAAVTKGRAVLYHEHQWPLIKSALVAHVQGLL